eukprot:CAMPEP_0114996144 /NCGR_PEP_ID=MMETSP0216-20121206/14138_1 /TAXON_ID=223996 /ORGANISM="Protocruzia adherens, Strain Boccale" /LENGTH=384 /DNA_ID=CAMNT_0002360297 /DNA_START=153 /DNA_END=1307 /DNA_ORIENTATION=+
MAEEVAAGTESLSLEETKANPISEIKLYNPAEEAKTGPGVLHEGWLAKRSGNVLLFNKYQDRYFRLRSDKVYYYDKKEATQPKGVIEFALFTNTAVRRPTTDRGEVVITEENFEAESALITKDTLELMLCVYDGDTIDRKFELKAPGIEEWKKWVTHLLSVAKDVKKATGGKAIKIGKERSWKYEHLLETNVNKEARTGDILLFKSRDWKSFAARWASLSEFDHIAMFLRTSETSVSLLEVSKERGVDLTSWDDFVAQKRYAPYDKLVYRALNVDRDQESIEKLQAFVAGSLGKSYRLDAKAVLKQYKSGADEEGEGVFPSQLVALCYKQLGLLGDNWAATTYWPVNFSASKELKLLRNASLGAEMLVFIEDMFKEQPQEESKA